MITTGINEAASAILGAHESGIPCSPVRDLLPTGDLDAAYAVQKATMEVWLKKGRRPVGRKIGLTSKSVQRQLGVDQPDFGMLYADMAVADGEECPRSSTMQPRVEAEIALVLERDLVCEQPTLADLIRATAFALPAIEIVGSRIANWNIKIVDTIADNASSGRYTLGCYPRALGSFDLRLCGMVMERRGEQVSLGAGVACLGNPLNAALWLARKMIDLGTPLRAGDTILSGALGPMVSVKPGDAFEARISGLGSVRAVFAQ